MKQNMASLLNRISNRINSQVKDVFSRAAFGGRIIRYNTPNLFQAELPLSDEGKSYLKDLKKKGYFVMPEKFNELADYVVEEYFQNADKGPRQAELFKRRKILDINPSDGKSIGRLLSWYVSFRDPRFKEILFNPELCGILCNFFRRQPYYRDAIHLTMDQFDEQVMLRRASKFHLDAGVHQLSVILALNDITEECTHTLYAEGSNTKYRYRETEDLHSFPDSWVEQNFTTTKLLAKKGSLVVFDAGNGFHKIVEKPNSIRKMLFINVTAGSNIKTSKLDSSAGWPELQQYPSYMRNMFSKTCQS
jgi:hypothetical protein